MMLSVRRGGCPEDWGLAGSVIPIAGVEALAPFRCVGRRRRGLREARNGKVYHQGGRSRKHPRTTAHKDGEDGEVMAFIGVDRS